MPVSFERYVTSIANGQNGPPSHVINSHHHFVHLPFSNFYNYTPLHQESQYIESRVMCIVNNYQQVLICFLNSISKAIFPKVKIVVPINIIDRNISIINSFTTNM